VKSKFVITIKSDLSRFYNLFMLHVVSCLLLLASFFKLSNVTKMCVKGKAVSATGYGGPQGCETLRLPHYLNSRLTDGSKVDSLTRRLPFTPQEDSWYLFLLEAESTPGP
jgi:hypothetical protein